MTEVLLNELVGVSEAVASTPSRTEKTRLLADVLGRLSAEEAAIGVSFLTGSPIQARLGVGHATIYSVEVVPARKPSLHIGEVDQIFQQLAAVSGPGSRSRRAALLDDLLGSATTREQEFLRGLITRNLRQGALEGVMADAVASALGVPPKKVRRAAMVEGDLVAASARALIEGPEALAGATMGLFTPVQPMLAKSADTAGAVVADFGESIVEAKLDGLRLQVHRQGDRVAVYTRNLRDVTADTPEIVAATLELGGHSFILDGEGLMVDETGRPLSFQDWMSRPDGGGDRPLASFYFDILHLDGVDLIDEPLMRRRHALSDLVAETGRARSIITEDSAAADRFFDEVVSAGFEGVVVKDPSQPYEAGRRGSGWVKVKPTHSLDLVVLGAEWGSGRRRGWLSNLHLGARDGSGAFVMLGKTFKGLTDEMLEWQTSAFLEIETRREGGVVFIEPEIIYEIAFDGVQRSTRYPGGVALRFARVKGRRGDKGPEDADDLETVKSYLR